MVVLLPVGLMLLRTVVETLTELGVTHVVTIGGDDTAFSSMAVSEFARKMGRTINVVHVPKTIDNDLFGTEDQFGAVCTFFIGDALLLELSLVLRGDVPVVGDEDGYTTALV